MATWTMYSNTQNHSAVTGVTATGQNRGARSYMNPHTPNTPTSPTANVGFKMPSKTVDHEEEERKKYLTAKYGQHQMRLIRKRLQVEDWVDEELQVIYNSEDTGSYDCEIDLDELLDLETDVERRQFVQEKLANARQSPVVINKFITELLEKASTL